MLESDDERTRRAAAKGTYSYEPTKAPPDEDEPQVTDTVKALKVRRPAPRSELIVRSSAKEATRSKRATQISKM